MRRIFYSIAVFMSHSAYAQLLNSKNRLLLVYRKGGPFILLMLVLLVCFSCKKDYNLPMLFTGEVTDIQEDGAVFSLKLADFKSPENIEFGFVWDKNTHPLLQTAEVFLIREPGRNGVFSIHISTMLEEGVTYYVRAFLRENDNVIYGHEMSFISLGSKAPTIDNFWPKAGNLGDTITITGNHFSNKSENNLVRLGKITCSIISAKQDTLRVIVPQQLNALTSIVSVSILGNSNSFAEPFNLIPPVINDFTPIGTYGDPIIITGENFRGSQGSLQVYFGNFKSNIITVHDQSITVTVPDSLNERECTIMVIMNNIRVSSSDLFQLAPLYINDFYPKTALTGDILTISGNNFSPLANNNTVYIGDIEATIVNAANESLEVKLPFQDSVIYPSRNLTVNVEVVGEQLEFSETLLINDKWFRLANSPITSSGSQGAPHTFVFNGKAYIGLENNKKLREYNPSSDSWTPLPDFPGVARQGGVGFLLNGKIYFGTGMVGGIYVYDWWEYNIEQKIWLQKNDFPIGPRSHAVAYSFEGYGYMVTGGTSEIYRYNTDTDIWYKVFSFYPEGAMRSAVSVINSKHAFIGLGNVSPPEYSNRIYKLNMSFHNWQRVPDFPFASNNNSAIGFELDDVVFIKTKYNPHFYYYNADSNSWVKLQTDILTDIREGIAFSINGKAYAGLGYSNAIWEYDPSR